MCTLELMRCLIRKVISLKFNCFFSENIQCCPYDLHYPLSWNGRYTWSRNCSYNTQIRIFFSLIRLLGRIALPLAEWMKAISQADTLIPNLCPLIPPDFHWFHTFLDQIMVFFKIANGKWIKKPPCLIKYFENTPEKLIINFSWPNKSLNQALFCGSCM